MNKNLIHINFVLVPENGGYRVEAYLPDGSLLEEKYCVVSEVSEITGDICRAEMLRVNENQAADELDPRMR